MANPFKARFDSTCQSCGEPLTENVDDVFAVNGSFICEDCARAGDNVCECGNFKKDSFDKCYECYQKETNPEPITDYDSPPF